MFISKEKWFEKSRAPLGFEPGEFCCNAVMLANIPSRKTLTNHPLRFHLSSMIRYLHCCTSRCKRVFCQGIFLHFLLFQLIYNFSFLLLLCRIFVFNVFLILFVSLSLTINYCSHITFCFLYSFQNKLILFNSDFCLI